MFQCLSVTIFSLKTLKVCVDLDKKKSYLEFQCSTAVTVDVYKCTEHFVGRVVA